MATMIREATLVQVGQLLSSWQKYIDDYRHRHPPVDLRDPVLLERLNINWLRSLPPLASRRRPRWPLSNI